MITNCNLNMAPRGLLLIIMALALLSSIQCRPKKDSMTHEEAKQHCMERTGLTYSEIVSINTRNENCAIDCTTKQGTVQTYYIRENTTCHDEKDYQCILGKCRKIGEVSLPNLYALEIRVLAAHVPDRDLVPTTGSSDTFVNIEVKEDGSPTYSDGELICHTYTVLDDDYPAWRNFVCKPLPMKLSTKLEFVAWDSDKPVVIPDFLGKASERVSSLMDQGPTKLPLRGGSNSKDNADYYIIVEVKGKKYHHDAEE